MKKSLKYASKRKLGWPTASRLLENDKALVSAGN
jgi:hypothetical protein